MTEAGEQWIVIRDWPKFQHYKDRDPVWIKNQNAMLHSDQYRELSYAQRGIFHGLLMEYSASHGQVPRNTRKLSRLLGQKLSDKSLIALNHAGLIDFVASKPIALRYLAASPHALAREEVLRTSSKEPRRSPPPKNGDGADKGKLLDVNELGRVKCPECGLERKTARQLAEHMYISHDGPEPDHWIEAERLADQ